MNETEWNSCPDPQRMLEFVHTYRPSKRKLRLCAVACCRRVWRFIPHGRAQQAVEVAERFADGLATSKELFDARSRACQAVSDRHLVLARARTVDVELPPPGLLAAASATDPFVGALARVVGQAAECYSPDQVARSEESAAQAALLRDIFGPYPFRKVVTGPSVLAWKDGLVVKLAQAAYDNRTLPSGALDPARLAVLADALEEAGCTDAEILAHLRGEGPHVKGCWAVDLLTGRE